MAFRPDFTLFDNNGRLFAQIEAKSKRGTTTEWASAYYENWMAQELAVSPYFFLLVTPDKIYIWKVDPDLNKHTAPNFTINAGLVLNRYLAQSNIDLSTISGPAFEMLVGAWLSDLVAINDEQGEEAVDMAEFSAAAKNMHVNYQVAQ